MSATTSAWGLSRAEWATTSLAAVVSATAYLTAGSPYLARGVVGDLAGFALLSAVVLVRGARLRHEALLCLTGIGVVVALAPDWPLRLPDAAWWALFTVGLAGYLALRRLRGTRSPSD